MNIAFAAPDKINGVLTITIEEADYAEDVEKELKKYRKVAKVPGFRPGAVPMSMLRKLHGTAVKMDVVTRLVSDNLHKYIKDNDIHMLGQALPSAQQEPQDLAADTTHTFIFDVAIAPAFEVSLSKKDALDYYKITVDDTLIDKQIDTFCSRTGHYDKSEEYGAGDMVKGVLVELAADGTPLDGGITVDDAIVMPTYFTDEAQKGLFEGTKVGDTLTISPRKMYGDSELASLLKVDKEEAVKHDGAFSYTIKECTRYVKAAVDQQLFDSVYGAGVCADETAFRSKVAEDLSAQLATNSDYKFLLDIRAYIEQSIGTLTYPDALLKRIMLADNEGKDADEIEKNYDESIHALTWHLIKEHLLTQYEIKIENSDVQAMAVQQARVLFAQYGMQNVPQEYVSNYAKELLKKEDDAARITDRVVEAKLLQVLKTVITITEKEVSFADFEQLISSK